jgi:hypothetical protein
LIKGWALAVAAQLLAQIDDIASFDTVSSYAFLRLRRDRRESRKKRSGRKEPLQRQLKSICF